MIRFEFYHYPGRHLQYYLWGSTVDPHDEFPTCIVEDYNRSQHSHLKAEDNLLAFPFSDEAAAILFALKWNGYTG